MDSATGHQASKDRDRDGVHRSHHAYVRFILLTVPMAVPMDAGGKEILPQPKLYSQRLSCWLLSNGRRS